MNLQSRRIQGALILIISTLVLSGCVTAKQKMLDMGKKPMTGAELQSLFSGKQVVKGKKHSNNRHFEATYLPDGSVVAVVKGKSYPGKYAIEGDRYCSYMDLRGGKPNCTTWFKVDENTYKLYDANGSLTDTVTFQ